jgi:hypothetical protein
MARYLQRRRQFRLDDALGKLSTEAVDKSVRMFAQRVQPVNS